MELEINTADSPPNENDSNTDRLDLCFDPLAIVFRMKKKLLLSYLKINNKARRRPKLHLSSVEFTVIV